MLSIHEISFKSIGEKQWEELVRVSDCASFFQTYHWIMLWLLHFEHTIEKTLIIAVYEDDILIGIGPFSVKNNCVEFLTLSAVECMHTLADYGDIIALASKEDIIWLAIIERLGQLTITHGYTIQLNNLCEHSISYSILIGLGNMHVEQIEVAPKLALPLDWSAYLAALPSHARHELKRKMKMGEAEGIRLSRSAINASSIQDYILLIEGANQQKQQFYSKSILKFFIQLFDHREVEVLFLYLETTVIASLILFNYKNDMLAYNSSYDLKFNRFSPGVVLFALAIQQAILAGKHGFDFSRGPEHYKYNFGAIDQKLYTFHR